MKRPVAAVLARLLFLPWLALPWLGSAQAPANGASSTGLADSAEACSRFETSADIALAAMRAKAQGMGVGGVALVAYFEGETIQSWSSKMVVVGRYTDPPTATDKGSNLLGIAYAKAAEMANTHKDSGTSGRPPLTGEFGWNGGVIARGKSGYWIAAFSGGKSEDDVQISREGMGKLNNGS